MKKNNNFEYKDVENVYFVFDDVNGVSSLSIYDKNFKEIVFYGSKLNQKKYELFGSFDNAVLCIDQFWKGNMYHCMDHIAKAIEYGNEENDSTKLFSNRSWPWAKVLIDKLIKNYDYIEPSKIYFVKKLSLFLPNIQKPVFFASLCHSDKFFNRLKALSYSMFDKDSPKKIYLSRRGKGTRSIINESIIEKYLEEKGFYILDGDFPVLEQMRLFSNADVVCSLHGAGLTNLVLCKPGTTVIELFSEKSPPCYEKIAKRFDLDYFPYNLDVLSGSVVPPISFLDDLNYKVIKTSYGFVKASSSKNDLLFFSNNIDLLRDAALLLSDDKPSIALEILEYISSARPNGYIINRMIEKLKEK